jgi:trehalose/maltose hydrolase-like predicted phosphorylase
MKRNLKEVKPLYPFDEWEIREESFNIENNYRNETIFSLGNGYIGFRGNFEEGYSGPEGTGVDGTYINGFYESEVIKYPEIAYGYAENSQTMLNVTNSKIIKLHLEDEEFNMLDGRIDEYERTLSLKEGILKRRLVWTSKKGKKISINIQRLVSLKNRHLAAISYEVTPINFSGKINLASMINGDVKNLTADDDPRTGSGLHGRVLSVDFKNLEGNGGVLAQGTSKSGMQLACAMENHIKTDNNYILKNTTNDLSIAAEYEIEAVQGKRVRLNKFISYVTSREYEREKLPSVARDIVLMAKLQGFDSICEEQKEFLQDFWFRTDVEIKGDPALQQGVRFNIYNLLQGAGRDGKTNIGAKGLTGEGYEGHYFWDTEMYVLPFFTYNNQEISRKLLEYRYSILDKARERARQMSHNKGALYSWRSINGEECSAFFPAGTAQYHINADIAFAIKRYMEATEDNSFLLEYGAEILFETARLWADLGEFIPNKGNKFCINCVTGPDEYTAVVNNNCYTNLMAKENMLYAFDIGNWMRENHPGEFKELSRKIELVDDELLQWKTVADNMYIPYDKELQLYMQDDSFLDKVPWDFENTPADKYPLLLNFHPLVIYRHQVCKQADLILAMMLLGNKFTTEEKKINYDFYEKVTTHDSSLSTAIFSIVANEIGYFDKSYYYFMSTSRMDLDNTHGNTKDGIHAANMAGTWMCLVNGFAGMRTFEGVLSFNPHLPGNWDEYSFKVSFKGRLIKVFVNMDGTKYELLEGESIKILHGSEERVLVRN